MYFEPKVIPAIEVQPTIDTDLKISADDEDDQDIVVETNKEKIDKNNAHDWLKNQVTLMKLINSRLAPQLGQDKSLSGRPDLSTR